MTRAEAPDYAAIHVTSVCAGGVYGHDVACCDAAGCAAGAEGYWGPVEAWPGVEAGHVYERSNGIVYEVQP